MERPRRRVDLRLEDRRLKKRAAWAALKAQKAALKARLAEEKAAIRAQLAANRPRRRSLRRRLALLVILILVWLLLRSCDCETPPGPPPMAPDGAPPVALVSADAALPDASPPRKRRKRGRITPRDRPAFVNQTPETQSWLAAFRVQVAARSPKLARCFEGTERPGALKWTAAVDIPRGVVSDQSLESVLTGVSLSKARRACLQGILKDPPYRLPSPPTRAGPSRVSIVIEF